MRQIPFLVAVLSAQLSSIGGVHASAWYLDLGIGVTVAEEQALNDAGADAEFDLGAPAVSLALGHAFGEHWRLEAELAFRDNDLETVYWPDGTTVLKQDPDDGVRTSSLMLNAMRGFRIGAFRPYLGGGIGMSRVESRMGAAPIGFGPNRIPRDPVLDDETDTLALQLIAGFEVPLSGRWGFAADYRLHHLPEFTLTGADGQDYEVEHTTHAATLHLRYLISGAWQKPASTPESPGTGWYLGFSLGSAFALDNEIQDSIENIDAFRTGPMVALAAGNAISPRWRLELALAWRENDAEVVDFNPEAGQFPASGQVGVTSLMAGAAYRFRPQQAVRPFVGIAVGAAWLDYDVTSRGSAYVDDTATAPAIELSAGLDIALNRQLDFVAEFRSFYTSPVNLDRPDGSPFETWHWVQSLNLGLRYSL